MREIGYDIADFFVIVKRIIRYKCYFGHFTHFYSGVYSFLKKSFRLPKGFHGFLCFFTAAQGADVNFAVAQVIVFFIVGYCYLAVCYVLILKLRHGGRDFTLYVLGETGDVMI